MSLLKSLFLSLRHSIKKPWEITGPCASPEYKSALPNATEYRRFCPATPPIEPIIPSADPERVFNIEYYTRDRRRNRPPIRRTILKKSDVERLVGAEKFEPERFPKARVPEIVEEDQDARGGGYQK